MDYSKLSRTPDEVERLFPWLRQDLIRGIPHWISPAWNKDRSRFDPEYYADCWERIGFKSVTLLTGHHDGFLLYPSKLMKQQPERDFFGEQVTACRKRDIRVLAYYSLTLDSAVGSEHPEWRARDLTGRIHQPNYAQFSHYHWLCLNSLYRDFAVAQLEEVMTRYDVEGAWIDIVYLPGHTQELERETCFCDHCHRQYEEWFRGEHLLDAVGTARHDEFRALTYRNFLAQLKAMLMSQERPRLLTFNGAGRRRMKGYRICDEMADLYSGEAHNTIQLSVTSKSHRNSGRPFELLSCAEVCWSHNQLKPDTLIKLESLSTLIAGGTYTIGITHAPDGRLSEANIERLAAWGQWTNSRAGLFQNSAPVYEVGMLAPELGPTDCETWAEWLRQGHFQFNVFMDLEAGKGGDPKGLLRHKVILVPHTRPLAAEEAQELREYVAAGGKLLLEFPAGPLRAHEPWLEELVGARQLRDEQAYAFYMLPEEGGLADDLPAGEPVQLYAKEALVLALTSGRTAGEVVAQFRDKVRTSDIQTVANVSARPDQAERWPGLVVNEVGAGQVLTTALPLTVPNQDAARCPWPRMLAQNLVRSLLGQQLVSVGAYSHVEVNLCRQPERLMLHFVNHGYGAGEFIHGYGEQEFLRELPVRLSPQLRESLGEARLEPEGEALALTEEGFILPVLGVHQAVSLK
jgi:alpha-L-fucosidase